MKRLILLPTILILSIFSLYGQQLKTSGKVIVNDQGEEVLLRGLGPGGWLLMEGYMMQTAGIAGTQHEFRDRLIDLMGEDKTETFFRAWRQHHFTRQDVDSLAKWGFNSIRVPMHYNLFTLPIEDEPVPNEQTWLTTGFTILDSLLDWCEANEMYLILDLHAAPGGQGANADISDYDPSKPSLWESDENKRKTVELWRKLAGRYKNEPWIGGYDLINEPNWELPGGVELRELYEDITTAIRATGDKHIIFIEGNWFANDFTGLTPPWDDNMVYSFHKYWDTNNENDLDWVLPMREEHNIPLWMGESGENSNTWYTNAVTLFENNNIGWAWWTMRKIESINSPYNIKMNSGYQKIIDYWKGEASRPTPEEAFASMMQLVDNLRVEKNEFRKDVVDALFRQVQSDEHLPYTKHQIPGTIHLSNYDLGENEIAYYDSDVANHQQSTGTFQAWNAGWSYRNDGVDIEKNNTAGTNGYHIGFVNKGEWMKYTVDISQGGIYDVVAKVSSEENGGIFHLEIDDQAITSVQKVSSTGSWTNFVDLEIQNVALPVGRHTLAFHIDHTKAFNISSLNFIKTAQQTLSFRALYAETKQHENRLQLHFNKEIEPSGINPSDFILKINNQVVSPSTVNVSGKIIELTFQRSFFYTDLLKLSYTGSSVISTGEENLADFTDLQVINKLKPRFLIPGTIEAEGFARMEGFQLEEANDEGGGQNLGFVNTGDFAEYPVYVQDSSTFQIEARIAGLQDNGHFALSLQSESATIRIAEIRTEPTGGWQTWSTQYATAVIPSGTYNLRLDILSAGEFNLNWISFTDLVTGFQESEEQNLIVPNPARDYFRIQSPSDIPVAIYSTTGQLVKTGVTNSTIETNDLKEGIYIIKIRNDSLRLLIK